MIGATRELDYFSAYIRLRDPGKSEDKAECDFRRVIDPLISWRESVGHKRGRGGGECEFNYLTTAVESSWEPRGELQLKQKIKDSTKGDEIQRLRWLR
ncbi:hypothetical protein B296_00016067 [Ensete ventricosum]|uniref:Uncharacterized protein n=1 Tax=Ensete ventricosum TaxID=4639 RepID=A0A426YSW1_ENSVE|nr:hypothetical protein B296_00016067 [Ensete ventricosum]